jgi:hypothetical protein
MAVITLSQALDRAQAGEPLVPNPALTASMALATNVLARQAASKEAKRQLQAQGLRPSQFSLRELTLRAEAYLAAHREELVAEAREIVARWQAEGVFGKRGGIHFSRARLNTDAQGGNT